VDRGRLGPRDQGWLTKGRGETGGGGQSVGGEGTVTFPHIRSAAMAPPPSPTWYLLLKSTGGEDQEGRGGGWEGQGRYCFKHCRRSEFVRSRLLCRGRNNHTHCHVARSLGLGHGSWLVHIRSHFDVIQVELLF